MIRALAQLVCKRLSLSSHGAVYFHHRRRGLLAWQGPDGRFARSTAAGARFPCAHSEIRSLSQRRSGHDESYQHGEVYVTDDGAETDLDLGHYERFTGVSARQRSEEHTSELQSLMRIS